MNNLLLLTINFPVDVSVGGYAWLFVVAIVSLAFAGMLRSILYVLLEVILSAALFSSLAAIPAIFYPLMGLQIIFGLILAYLLIRAIDRNYQQIMEKTHQFPRRITQNNYTGLK